MSKDIFVAPSAPKDACFTEDEFSQDTFDADRFLLEHRKNVSLEKMRDDLGVYLKILRSSMIELINKDYADFVNLSSNLIGVDKAINKLEVPLGQLKEEVVQIKKCVEDAISDMTELLESHHRVRNQRQSLQSLMRYHKSITKLKNILASCGSSNAAFRPDILERAASEFNQLKFHTSRCKIEIPAKDIMNMSELDIRLKKNLNDFFINCIREKNSVLLVRCLRIYLTLDKTYEAERIVQTNVVIPAVQDIISEQTLQKDPQELKGLFMKLEKVLDEQLKELLEVRSSVKGFNFLVNSYWIEIEDRIENHIPIIFATGDPSLFHKRYRESLNFLLRLEQKNSCPETIQSLKTHPQYQRFLKKWNLTAYFQIRFQEIAGTAESILSANVSASSIRNDLKSVNSDEFTLHATCILWDCIMRLWAPDVYLPQLLHKFWKLFLQLCARYEEWCHRALQQNWMMTINETNQVYETENLGRLKFLVGLYSDLEKLSMKVSNFMHVIGEKIYSLSSKMINLLNDSSVEMSRKLETCLPLISQEIVTELLKHSAQHLKEVADIPRLYRGTFRGIPETPSAYVKKVLDFLTSFHNDYKDIIPNQVEDWLRLSLASLTNQYLSSVNEVLTSVQKTGESLRKLKEIRNSKNKNAGNSGSEKQGTTDDEKIRMQLHIDVLSYIKTIDELRVNPEDIPTLKSLKDEVESAVQNKS